MESMCERSFFSETMFGSENTKPKTKMNRIERYQAIYECLKSDMPMMQIALRLEFNVASLAKWESEVRGLIYALTGQYIKKRTDLVQYAKTHDIQFDVIHDN
jgi:hypothetical protein